MHLGSWRHAPGEHRSLSYREIAEPLVTYVTDMGYTHVELLPLMEHPFYGSWGYQTTGYFAPTSRYGAPGDLMELIDVLHQHGIGVILDWVPSHFPSDEHGLGFFDGTHLFEHADPRKGFHPDWNSLIFNYDRHEVRSFLLSSAHFWFDRYHIDGLRVDAVASMLYLDYSRKAGEWVPNEHGGNENLGALRFLKSLNETAVRRVPRHRHVRRGVDGVADGVAPDRRGRPRLRLQVGHGLDARHARVLRARTRSTGGTRQDELTFRAVYAFTENFTLPLSHDEVVHGKGSLLGKMPGDQWQQLANLRALFGYQYAQPGKKLLFMGDDLACDMEWDHDDQLPWAILDRPGHEGVRRWVATLNHLVAAEPGLHEVDFDPAGFEWIDASDTAASVLSFIRHPRRDAAGAPTTPAAPRGVVRGQPHPRPPTRLRHRRAPRGTLGRAGQQRRRGLRRQRVGQLRRRRRGGHAHPRATVPPAPRPATALGGLPRPRISLGWVLRRARLGYAHPQFERGSGSFRGAVGVDATTGGGEARDRVGRSGGGAPPSPSAPGRTRAHRAAPHGVVVARPRRLARAGRRLPARSRAGRGGLAPRRRDRARSRATGESHPGLRALRAGGAGRRRRTGAHRRLGPHLVPRPADLAPHGPVHPASGFAVLGRVHLHRRDARHHHRLGAARAPLRPAAAHRARPHRRHRRRRPGVVPADHDGHAHPEP